MSKRISKDSIDHFLEYGFYPPTRTLYMGSIGSDLNEAENGVDFAMAEQVIKALHILDNASNEPITIIMNNPGGDVYHGLAIYDAIRACKSHVTIKVYGQALSMGSIILQAADKRVMSKNSRLMIHDGQYAIDGEVRTIYKNIDETKELDNLCANILHARIKEKHPDYSLNKLKKKLDRDTFFNCTSALEIGLIDEIEGE